MSGPTFDPLVAQRQVLEAVPARKQPPLSDVVVFALALVGVCVLGAFAWFGLAVALAALGLS